MHDELTQVDIDKMKEELQHRIQVLRPQLIEEVKVAPVTVVCMKIRWADFLLLHRFSSF